MANADSVECLSAILISLANYHWYRFGDGPWKVYTGSDNLAAVVVLTEASEFCTTQSQGRKIWLRYFGGAGELLAQAVRLVHPSRPYPLEPTLPIGVLAWSLARFGLFLEVEQKEIVVMAKAKGSGVEQVKPDKTGSVTVMMHDVMLWQGEYAVAGSDVRINLSTMKLTGSLEEFFTRAVGSMLPILRGDTPASALSAESSTTVEGDVPELEVIAPSAKTAPKLQKESVPPKVAAKTAVTPSLATDEDQLELPFDGGVETVTPLNPALDPIEEVEDYAAPMELEELQMDESTSQVDETSEDDQIEELDVAVVDELEELESPTHVETQPEDLVVEDVEDDLTDDDTGDMPIHDVNLQDAGILATETASVEVQDLDDLTEEVAMEPQSVPQPAKQSAKQASKPAAKTEAKAKATSPENEVADLEVANPKTSVSSQKKTVAAVSTTHAAPDPGATAKAAAAQKRKAMVEKLVPMLSPGVTTVNALLERVKQQLPQQVAVAQQVMSKLPSMSAEKRMGALLKMYHPGDHALVQEIVAAVPAPVLCRIIVIRMMGLWLNEVTLDRVTPE